MLAYIIRRILWLIPTLIGITVITFAIIQLAPGDPVELQMMGGESFQSQKDSVKVAQQLKKLYGLDKPIHIQYLIWLKRVLTFDFGESFHDGRPVINKILDKVWNTIQLNILSILLVLGISLPVGVMAAAWQHGWFDKISAIVLYVLYSLPDFWIALLLLLYFGVELGWLPIYGMSSSGIGPPYTLEWIWDRILHLILPVTALTYPSFAYMARFVRGNMLESIRQDYVRTARAKGLSESTVIFRHALRNTLIPVVTLLGLTLPTLISGAVIIEYIFSWPGMGRLYFEAVLTRDYPTIMGLAVISSLLVLVGTLLADLVYAWVDPRVSYS